MRQVGSWAFVIGQLWVFAGQFALAIHFSRAFDSPTIPDLDSTMQTANLIYCVMCAGVVVMLVGLAVFLIAYFRGR